MITDYFIDEILAMREREATVTNIKFSVSFNSVRIEKDVVDIYFTFSALYEDRDEKKIGEIKMVGHLIDRENNEEMARMIDNYWSTKKSLPKGVLDRVINVLNFECGARGTLVAYAMAFPPPLPLSPSKNE